MTAFSLFHQSTFAAKLRGIGSVTQLAALLASMFAFSARHRSCPDQGNSEMRTDDFDDNLGPSLSPKHFEKLSLRYVDEALAEYNDASPPLAVLQALILLTFIQLIKGVRGAAWRRLGICVRVAYELELHHVDRDNTPEQENPDDWCMIEERRRAWWAVWEMDVFASMIRRCPTAVDWTDVETRLPVLDEDWFGQKFSPSCFLEKKPILRLNQLQQCGTQSHKAWFIVLYSFMREGHMLSKFRSPRPGVGTQASYWGHSNTSSYDNTESLAILANALKCFCMALPKHLRHREGNLTFSSPHPGTAVAVRQLHSAKYSIHTTIQLTRMMIHHQDAYRGAQQDLHLTGVESTQTQDSEDVSEDGSFSLRLGPAREGLQQFIEAADELLRIVSCSSEDHIRYVNPFCASVIWYGAVVHLGWKVLSPPSTNTEFIESKFAVMHLILVEFSEFWDLPRALQENLAAVEGKLRLFTRPKHHRLSSSNKSGHPSGIKDQSSQMAGDTINLQRTTSRDYQTGNQFSVLRSSTAPDTRPSLAHNQNDNMATASQQFLSLGAHLPPEGIANVNEGSMQDQQDFMEDPSIIASMRDIGAKNNSGNNTNFVTDESCLLNNDLVVLNGDKGYLDRAPNSYQPPGLWDDLAWDVDFAMDPTSLFRGIMEYNN
jgi:hypothetical protein